MPWSASSSRRADDEEVGHPVGRRGVAAHEAQRDLRPAEDRHELQEAARPPSGRGPARRRRRAAARRRTRRRPWRTPARGHRRATARPRPRAPASVAASSSRPAQLGPVGCGPTRLTALRRLLCGLPARSIAPVATIASSPRYRRRSPAPGPPARAALAGADDAEGQAVGAGLRARRAQRGGQVLVGADGIARDEQRAAQDALADEDPAAGVHAMLQVAAQLERAERVGAVGADDRRGERRRRRRRARAGRPARRRRRARARRRRRTRRGSSSRRAAARR